MNDRTVLITFIIVILCRNNVQILGFNETTIIPAMVIDEEQTLDYWEPESTLIPPGQCAVSLTVNPSPAILGSVITFDANLNCSVIPPIEYQCCYYFWQDNISDNVTVTDGLKGSTFSRIYSSEFVKKNEYLMEVTVCWLKSLVSKPHDLQESVCDYAVAVKTVVFELTDTLNGYMEFKQDRKYPGSPSVLMIGAEASVTFVPTDQRFQSLTYRWFLNASDYLQTNDSTILFIPTHVGVISFDVFVSDRVSHNNGSFKHFIYCKEPILDAVIKGEERLLVGSNGTFVVIYMGSAPFTFCWETDASDSAVGPYCIYDLNNTDEIGGSTVFYVQAGNESGKQKISGNLTNDVSKMVLTYEFHVLAEVNIRSGVLVAILIVGVFMSSMLTYIILRKQPEIKRRLPVEVADFDFCPGIAADRRNSSLAVRARQLWRFRIFPVLFRIKEAFKPVTQNREMYTSLAGSCIEEGSARSNKSYHNAEAQKDKSTTNPPTPTTGRLGTLQMRSLNTDSGPL